MGANADATRVAEILEAKVGQLVAAGPGYFLLRFQDDEPEPILAWRISSTATWPVTAFGNAPGEEPYVLHPDGKIRPHFRGYGSAPPIFDSIDHWRKEVTPERAANASPGMSGIRMVTTTEYFGGCPTCGGNDGYRNLGREHWFFCAEHKVKWYVGSSLFSGWREETVEDRTRIFLQMIIQTHRATTSRFEGNFQDETREHDNDNQCPRSLEIRRGPHEARYRGVTPTAASIFAVMPRRFQWRGSLRFSSTQPARNSAWARARNRRCASRARLRLSANSPTVMRMQA
jgi:hypothetical protein